MGCTNTNHKSTHVGLSLMYNYWCISLELYMISLHLLSKPVFKTVKEYDSISWINNYLPMFNNVVKQLSSRHIFHDHKYVSWGTDYLVPAQWHTHKLTSHKIVQLVGCRQDSVTCNVHVRNWWWGYRTRLLCVPTMYISVKHWRPSDHQFVMKLSAHLCSNNTQPINLSSMRHINTRYMEK